MGTTYLLTNCSKRQYFDPNQFDGAENTKRSGILWGLSGHALAQLLLPQCRLDFHLEPWIGDALVLLGDDCEPNSIELLKPFQATADEHAYHIATEQFDNITLNLVAVLCKRDNLMEHFLDNAEQHYHGFVNLAHIIMYLGAFHIELAVVNRFGKDWRDRYHETLQSEPWHYPLPMTPESRNTRRSHVLRAIDVVRAREEAE